MIPSLVTGPPKQLLRIADSPPLPSPLFDNYFARYPRKISFSDELSAAVAIITVAFNCTLDQRKHFHTYYTRVLVNGITGDRCIESESLPFGDSERKNHGVKALRRDE